MVPVGTCCIQTTSGLRPGPKVQLAQLFVPTPAPFSGTFGLDGSCCKMVSWYSPHLRFSSLLQNLWLHLHQKMGLSGIGEDPLSFCWRLYGLINNCALKKKVEILP